MKKAIAVIIIIVAAAITFERIIGAHGDKSKMGPTVGGTALLLVLALWLWQKE